MSSTAKAVHRNYFIDLEQDADGCWCVLVVTHTAIADPLSWSRASVTLIERPQRNTPTQQSTHNSRPRDGRQKQRTLWREEFERLGEMQVYDNVKQGAIYNNEAKRQAAFR